MIGKIQIGDDIDRGYEPKPWAYFNEYIKKRFKSGHLLLSR
jgi:hypothetical protein